MLGSDLQTLAHVADLAKIDLDPRSGRVRLSTTYKDNAIAAQYVGVAATGCAWLQRDMGIEDLEIDVEAQRFAAVADLFDSKEQVSLRMQGATGLRLVGEKTKQRVLLGTFESEGFIDLSDEVIEYAVVEAKALAEEIVLASDFCAKSISKPVLTGIRIEAVKGELRLMAFNGFSMVFAGRIIGEIHETLAEVVVLPVRELVPCLKLVRGGSVSLCVDDNGCAILRGDSSWVRVPTLDASQWPDLRQLGTKYDRQSVTLPSSVLNWLSKAVKALDADAYVHLSGKDGQIILRSVASETGQYVTTVPGEMEGERYYDVEHLGLAAKINDELVLEIAPGMAPTLVRGKDRRVWLTPRNR